MKYSKDLITRILNALEDFDRTTWSTHIHKEYEDMCEIQFEDGNNYTHSILLTETQMHTSVIDKHGKTHWVSSTDYTKMNRGRFFMRLAYVLIAGMNIVENKLIEEDETK